jgi:hypothetical protein
MKKLLIIILTFACSLCNAQNLVNNWSFEDTVACPTTLTQIDRAVGWMSFRLTPDYFNACSPSNVPVPVSVPHNIWGDQLAHTGDAYAGFVAYKAGATNTREFIATQLNQQLIIGQKYFLSFWVSSAFGYIQNQYPSMACNNIGAKFSTVAYSGGFPQTNPQTVDNFPHIVDTTIINDTINWVKISGSFIADSAYQYLSIGNFYDDINSSYVIIGSSLPNDAYYYLDDVKLSTDSDFVNSIDKYNFNLIKTFPNPARDWIVVSGSKLNEIILYDILGNLCYKATDLFTSTLKINISSFSDGIYFIRIKSGKEYITKKIIINN